jgi:hypothetical protein
MKNFIEVTQVNMGDEPNNRVFFSVDEILTVSEINHKGRRESFSVAHCELGLITRNGRTSENEYYLVETVDEVMKKINRAQGRIRS